jgi:DNA-binding CsgD family transcriptional regulator
VYPIHVDNINSEEYKSFLYILQNVNFDVVIHNNHSTAECVNNIKSLFPRSLHIQSNFSNFGLTTYYDYVGTFDGDPRNGTVLRTSYSKNYVEDFINDVISLAGDKKTVAIFAGSTRKLANLHTVGLKKIIDGTKIEANWIAADGEKTVDTRYAIKLTQRQIDVLSLICQGKSNREIAAQLAVAEITAKAHVSAIFRELKVVNRTQALLAAQRLGLATTTETTA